MAPRGKAPEGEAEKVVTVFLRRDYELRGKVYGPGVTKVPEDLAAAVGADPSEAKAEEKAAEAALEGPAVAPPADADAAPAPAAKKAARKKKK